MVTQASFALAPFAAVSPDCPAFRLYTPKSTRLSPMNMDIRTASAFRIEFRAPTLLHVENSNAESSSAFDPRAGL